MGGKPIDEKALTKAPKNRDDITKNYLLVRKLRLPKKIKSKRN